ncbi:MAG: hypothetical protein A2148_08835 [Chloroflexi bacterium RBG_16_68_14]|nr:MAG: hypothetical protein A2148_08835 [Chloroflexi bacterium RBG_16_68_14]
MPDMLVRLYDLPDPTLYYLRAEEAGASVHRAQPWNHSAVRKFVEEHFSSRWADEAELAFVRQPISMFIAMTGQEIIGFAAYEVTTRDYFGPTGVREDWRGRGIGASLLFRCLAALWEMGYAYAIIGGVGEALQFYEKLCGAFSIPGSEQGIYKPR